jgi:hypothetical protein
VSRGAGVSQGARHGARAAGSIAVILTLLCAVDAMAQDPAGPEFLVNTYTTARQFRPAVAVDAAGSFVVAWETTGQDGSGYGVSARRFTASGRHRGTEFQVNTFTTDAQADPAVGSDENGNFVIVWTSDDPSAGWPDVFARRYDAEGTPLGPEFRVNSYTTLWQMRPSVAVSTSGAFVVVWSGPDGSGAVHGSGVFAQRYDAAGTPLGSEFRVNSYSEQDQDSPVVAMDPYGDFVVVWTSTFQDGDDMGVFGQRFDSSGAARGGEFRVNTSTAGYQWFPSVGMGPNSDFTVVWQGPQDGSDDAIFGQRYGASGQVEGGEFRVNSYTTGAQWFPSIAMGATGFVAFWDSPGQDGHNSGVFGQRYDLAGSPVGGEFLVNTATYSLQGFSAAAMDPAGNFVVVWSGRDGSDTGIFGQRFSDLLFADGFEG